MVFDERKLLVQHDSKHRVTCDICNMEMLPSSLRAHLFIHTDIHKCPICDTRHTSKASLEKHVQARHTKQKGFVCHVCGKQNSCQSSMNRHMAYHSDERPYKSVERKITSCVHRKEAYRTTPANKWPSLGRQNYRLFTFRSRNSTHEAKMGRFSLLAALARLRDYRELTATSFKFSDIISD
ncbi:hypothetical protein Trydic_g6404 [Trypoxylus dichotomus]